MITCHQCKLSSGSITLLPCDEIASCLSNNDSLVWVNLCTPTEDELKWLETAFHFHPLAMEDVRSKRERTKLDRYEGYYYFVLHAFSYREASHLVKMHKIDLFIGKQYLVSIESEKVACLDVMRERLTRTSFPDLTTSFLAYLFIDAIVDDLLPITDKIGNKIDQIDTSIVQRADRKILRPVFALRRSLLNIRKQMAPLRDAINELLRDENCAELCTLDQANAYYHDVYDHTLRILDLVDTYREMLLESIDAYQSSLSNTLNENMQRLTVLATVLASGAMITGYFGMNVHGAFINSANPYSGWYVLATLVVVTVVEIWLFHRKDWI